MTVFIHKKRINEKTAIVKYVETEPQRCENNHYRNEWVQEEGTKVLHWQGSSLARYHLCRIPYTEWS